MGSLPQHEYCELDTLAMVMIVQAWRGMQVEADV